LVFCDLIGGTNFDYGYRVAVDASDAIYVMGYTTSNDFPKVPGSADTIYNSLGDVFALKLNATGTQLGYSTYLGGSLVDTPAALAVDASGAAYLGGNTKSANFPTTAGSFDPKPDGGQDGFLAKLAPSGTKFLMTTFLGGISDDAVAGIALAAPNQIWVVGSTFSKNFPIIGPAIKSKIYQLDSFVTKVDLGPVPILCLDSAAPVEVSYDQGAPPGTGATRTITNCGSPESSLVWHVSELVDAPWLAENPASGTVNDGSPSPVDLDFDPTGLADGAYTTTLRFENDGEAGNHFDVPVLLTIQQPVVVPFVPGDALSGAIDFAGEWDAGSFSAIKGMVLKVGISELSGDVAPVLELVDANDQIVKSCSIKHSTLTAKRTFAIPKDGNYRLVVRGSGYTAGAYAISTAATLPKDAKPYAKKKQPGKPAGAPLEFKIRCVAGATLAATVEPATAITGPLALALLDPTQTTIDVSSYTQPFGNGGLQVVGVPIATAGLHTLVVSGLASPKEKINVTLTPTQPPAGAPVALP
jgi:hypothetical protein